MTDLPESDAIERLRASQAEFKTSDARRQAAVLDARRVGVSWTTISEVMGTTKQGARQRYIGAEEISKMAEVLDVRLKLFAHGHGRVLSYAEALQFAHSQGVLNDTQTKAVRAVYELHREAALGNLVPMKQADLLADACIAISAALVVATPSAIGCTHPTRGGQEHILSAGTGDYHCRVCGEAMPIVAKPSNCLLCGSTSSDLEPDPLHGNSWRCSECGENWGWVRS